MTTQITLILVIIIIGVVSAGMITIYKTGYNNGFNDSTTKALVVSNKIGIENDEKKDKAIVNIMKENDKITETNQRIYTSKDLQEVINIYNELSESFNKSRVLIPEEDETKSKKIN